MHRKGDYTIETANQTHNYNYYLRKTLQFLVLISIISFMVFYLSGFSLFFFLFHDLHSSTLTFPFLAQALDRKCMFLICNGILAFLANNLKFTTSSSGLNNYGGFMKSNIDEDGVKQIPELPEISEVRENAASMEYVDTPPEKHISLQQEEDYGSSQREAEELIEISEDWGEEDEDEDEEEVVEESASVEDTSVKEEVNDMRVSTEELNKRFEEFIRRMKEEIRIEAQQ